MVILVFTVIIAFMYIVGTGVFYIGAAVICKIMEIWEDILGKDDSRVFGYTMLTLLAIVVIFIIIFLIAYKCCGM